MLADYLIKHAYKALAILALMLGIGNAFMYLTMMEKVSQVKSLGPCAIYTLQGEEVYQDLTNNTYDTLQYYVGTVFVNERQGLDYIQREKKRFYEQEISIADYRPVSTCFTKVCHDETTNLEDIISTTGR